MAGQISRYALRDRKKNSKPMNLSCQKKKIAIIASSAPPMITGGISSAHYNLYRMLKKKGFNAKIFTYTDHDPSHQMEDDIIRNGSSRCLSKIVLFIGRFYSLILRLLEKVEFAYQFPYIFESAIGSLKINKFLRQFQPEVIVLPDNGAPGYFIKKIKDCRTIFISHHNPSRFTGEPLLGLFSKIDVQLAMSLENRSLKKVDKVICPSAYMKAVFTKTHEFKGPIAIIPNLVDNDQISTVPAFDIRKELGMKHDAPVIYIPSAGVRLKGSQFVFEIIRRLSTYYNNEICFYLSGTIFDQLLKRELEFIPGNARIYNPGNLSYYDNIAVVKGCSYCVTPTLIESFGMAILESNLCGLPVITFNVGGNADIITNGLNGFLVPFMDIEGLLSHSERLLDAHYLIELRQKTFKYMRDKFEQEKILDSYINYLIT
jgi:glycosyltransferase involved in cell wall biosynthesis